MADQGAELDAMRLAGVFRVLFGGTREQSMLRSESQPKKIFGSGCFRRSLTD